MIYSLKNVRLVVSTNLKNISQLGLFFPIYGKIKFMFQTTNCLVSGRFQRVWDPKSIQNPSFKGKSIVLGYPIFEKHLNHDGLYPVTVYPHYICPLYPHYGDVYPSPNPIREKPGPSAESTRNRFALDPSVLSVATRILSIGYITGIHWLFLWDK